MKNFFTAWLLWFWLLALNASVRTAFLFLPIWALWNYTGLYPLNPFQVAALVLIARACPNEPIFVTAVDAMVTRLISNEVSVEIF